MILEAIKGKLYGLVVALGLPAALCQAFGWYHRQARHADRGISTLLQPPQFG